MAARCHRTGGWSQANSLPMNLSFAQLALQHEAREFAEAVAKPRSAEIDRSGEYPWDVVAKMAAAGLLGMTIPIRYGGRGASYFDAVLVIEQLAKACTVTSAVMVETEHGRARER